MKGATFIRGKYLIEGEDYFDLSVCNGMFISILIRNAWTKIQQNVGGKVISAFTSSASLSFDFLPSLRYLVICFTFLALSMYIFIYA